MRGYIIVKGTNVVGWSNSARRSNLDNHTKKIKVDFNNVVIPNGITHVLESPFSTFCEVKKLNIPASVECISKDFFENTSNSTELHYAGTLEEWCKIKKPNGIEHSLTCGYVIHAIDGVKDYR